MIQSKRNCVQQAAEGIFFFLRWIAGDESCLKETGARKGTELLWDGSVFQWRWPEEYNLCA